MIRIRESSFLLVALGALLLAGCADQKKDAAPAAAEEPSAAPAKAGDGEKAAAAEKAPSSADALKGEVVVYAGRKLALVKPVIEMFEKQTGVKVKVRDGQSAELASLLLEEGAKSTADVFWSQDAGSLGRIEKQGLLAEAPKAAADAVALFPGVSEHWIPVTGRARTIAYAADVEPDAMPKSVFELTDPKYKGQVGWAPTNASFQGFVTAMRVQHGDEKTEAWLKGMAANGAKTYPKNTPIIHALAAKEIRYGLPNHYYLLREKKTDAKYPVEQTFFGDGDTGNLVNVSGAGVLRTSKNPVAASAFVAFLVGKDAQSYFAKEVLEYPVAKGVETAAGLLPQADLAKKAPKVDLRALGDAEATRALLRKVGLL
jgi:iron(III) transport system substrate-binding protein